MFRAISDHCDHCDRTEQDRTWSGGEVGNSQLLHKTYHFPPPSSPCPAVLLCRVEMETQVLSLSVLENSLWLINFKFSSAPLSDISQQFLSHFILAGPGLVSCSLSSYHLLWGV